MGKNYKIVGHKWEVVYNEECFSMQILLNKPMYDQIKAKYEEGKRKISESEKNINYETLYECQRFAMEVLEPIVDNLIEDYNQYLYKLIMSDEEVLNGYVLNCGDETVIDSELMEKYVIAGKLNDNSKDEHDFFFKLSFQEKLNVLLPKDNILDTFRFIADWTLKNPDDEFQFRFEDYDFEAFWSTLNVVGSL